MRRVILLAGVLILLIMSACQSPEEDEKPNIMFILADEIPILHLHFFSYLSVDMNPKDILNA